MFGFDELVRQHDGFVVVVTITGAIFLFLYGLMALRRAQNPIAMSAAQYANPGVTAAITTCLALTFLNPHVYLDTVLLLGGISTRYEGNGRTVFGLGAVTATFLWFFALGYGAQFLTRWLENPKA